MIFLAVLAFISALLLVPVGIDVTVGTRGTEVRLRYLFIKYSLTQQKKASKKKKKIKKKESESEKITDSLGSITDLLRLLSECAAPVRRLLKRTVIKNVELSITVASDDAARTAINYGRIYAAVANALALAGLVFTLKLKRVDVLPDFTSDKMRFDASFCVRIVPLAALAALISIGIKLFKLTANNPSNLGRTGIKDGRKTSDKRDTRVVDAKAS